MQYYVADIYMLNGSTIKARFKAKNETGAEIQADKLLSQLLEAVSYKLTPIIPTR